MRLSVLASAFVLVAFFSSPAQQPTPAQPPVPSPEKPAKRVVSLDPAAIARQQAVHSPVVAADGRLTFYAVAPNAKSVAVTIEGESDPRPMQLGADGIWSVTTEPKQPEYYEYRFIVDGDRELDAHNPNIRENLMVPSSVVHVPGSPAKPWDLQDIPHGTVEHTNYISKLATDEDGLRDRDMYVYLPPNYDARRKQKYPVLYLLEGYGYGAIGWTDAAQANWILDWLLAQGKIAPMVVVMPRAYGTMKMITQGWSVWTPPYTLPLENQNIFEQMMLKEVLPLAEARYNIATDSAHRALAGLSMGGGHSIHTGLNHPETFGYVGAFSSAIVAADAPVVPPGTPIPDSTYAQIFAGMVPNAKTQTPFKLFLLSCGTEDGLITTNRAFGAWAKQNVKGNVSINETSGMHTWLVWRENLITFSQLLWK